MIDFSIRRLRPGDSLDDLTTLLHRAFAPMGRRGLNCPSVDQTSATTRQRVERGDCFVAVADRQVVGTITLEVCDPFAEIRRYRSPDVASIHQFAVDPAYQGAGIGHALLQVAGAWARARRFSELALDTPARASELRRYYAAQGFEWVGLARLAGRTYASAVMAKPVGDTPKSAAIHPWPARRPAEMAAMAQEASERGVRPKKTKGSASASLLTLGSGAGERSRTLDLLITNELLYQLSYTGVSTTSRLGCREACHSSAKKSRMGRGS